MEIKQNPQFDKLDPIVVEEIKKIEEIVIEDDPHEEINEEVAQNQKPAEEIKKTAEIEKMFNNITLGHEKREREISAKKDFKAKRPKFDKKYTNYCSSTVIKKDSRAWRILSNCQPRGSEKKCEKVVGTSSVLKMPKLPYPVDISDSDL